MRFCGICYEFVCRRATHVASGQNEATKCGSEVLVLLTNAAAKCVKYLAHALCAAHLFVFSFVNAFFLLDICCTSVNEVNAGGDIRSVVKIQHPNVRFIDFAHY